MATRAYPVIFAPAIEISLEFICGCRWATTVHRVPEGEMVDQHCAEPCIPATCPTCLSFGRACATRAGMAPAYAPVQFSDVVPSKRMRYKRIKGT